MGKDEEEMKEEIEERLINEEYKIWKKNTHFSTIWSSLMP